MYKRQVQTFVNETDELVHVFAGGEKIVTTPEHPFYIPEFGWTSAIQLRAGDILLLSNGNYVVVEKVQHEILETPITVYNFEVEGLHTYFVGSNSILVHNSCKRDIKQISDIAKKFKIDRWGFGDYVEDYKISKGLRDGATLSWKVLEKLAKEYKRR